jgi:hypothetical protein
VVLTAAPPAVICGPANNSDREITADLKRKAEEMPLTFVAGCASHCNIVNYIDVAPVVTVMIKEWRL